MGGRSRWRYDQQCTSCRRTLEPPETGSAGYTRDHVVPRAMGGRRTVPCCRACNDLKGHVAPAAWARFRRDNPQWWKLWKGRKTARVIQRGKTPARFDPEIGRAWGRERRCQDV